MMARAVRAGATVNGAVWFAVFCVTAICCAIFAPPVVAQPAISSGVSTTQMEQALSGPGIAIAPGSLNVLSGTSNQYGTFTNGETTTQPGETIGIGSGIFLSTGRATSIVAPNNQGNVSDVIGTFAADPQLTAIDPNATNDPVLLQFRATPAGSVLQISFVFASDEYPEYVCSRFNDAFAFFIKPTTSSTWQNIATVPGTNTPIVVNNINSGSPGANADGTACDLSNSAFFRANGDGSTPTQNANLQFDGLTTTLVANASVAPGTTYDVKLAIADSSDANWDSAVFVKWVSSSNFSDNIDLELDLTASATNVTTGDDVTFTLDLTNNGPDAAVDTVVAVTLPDGFNPISDTSGGAYDPATGLWTLPADVAANGGTASIDIVARAGVQSGALDAFAEVQSVDAADTDSIPGNGAQTPAEDDEDTVSLNVTGPTAFTCTNDLYQIATSSSVLRRITVSGTSSSFSNVGTGAGQQVNSGWGHNSQDDLIYGIPGGSTDMWVVDANGVFYNLGPIANMGGRAGSNAGDVTDDGRMIVKTGAGEFSIIDLTTTPFTRTSTVSLSGDAASANPIDIAYNPIDGNVYSIDPATDRLFFFDPDTGVSQAFGPATFTGSFGAQWVDENGRFYVYDNGTNELSVIDIGTNGSGTGDILLLATSSNDEGGINDGAFCRGPPPVDLGSISGTVFNDSDRNNSYDAGTESGLAPGIRLTLYNQGTTPGNRSDDTLVGTTLTAADGSYTFPNVLAGESYLIEIDEADTDIPANASIGTPNPLNSIQVNANQAVTGVDFGFDVAGDLELAKVVDNLTPGTGDTVTFTLTLTNADGGLATNVVVTDQLPAGLTYVSDTSGGTYDPNAGTWTVASLAGNTSVSIDIAATVNASGDLTNRAEITASDAPDRDSDVNASFDVDDLGDGIADDDEASVTLTRTDLTISGTVFEDNGAAGGTAHDGAINGGELGLAGVGVRAIDDSNGTVYATTTTAGDGTYSLVLPAAAAGRAVRIETNVLTDLRAISDAGAGLPSLSDPSETDARIVFTPVAATAHTGVDFGQVRNPTLTKDQTVSAFPGGAVILAHAYTSKTSASVTFSLTNVAANPSAAFSQPTLFRDNDCNGQIDGGDAPLTGAVTTGADQQICILARVQASAGAPPGSQISFDIAANTAFTGTSEADALVNTDIVSLSGAASLDIAKAVRNVTTGTSFGTANRATPGQVLEYRLVFQNTGAEPVFNVNVFDNTPAFTSLAATLPAPVTTPAGMACAVVNPAGGGGAGYTGRLQWRCTGGMSPGAEGELRFQVRLDP